MILSTLMTKTNTNKEYFKLRAWLGSFFTVICVINESDDRVTAQLFEGIRRMGDKEKYEDGCKASYFTYFAIESLSR